MARNVFCTGGQIKGIVTVQDDSDRKGTPEIKYIFVEVLQLKVPKTQVRLFTSVHKVNINTDFNSGQQINITSTPFIAVSLIPCFSR